MFWYVWFHHSGIISKWKHLIMTNMLLHRNTYEQCVRSRKRSSCQTPNLTFHHWILLMCVCVKHTRTCVRVWTWCCRRPLVVCGWIERDTITRRILGHNVQCTGNEHVHCTRLNTLSEKHLDRICTSRNAVQTNDYLLTILNSSTRPCCSSLRVREHTNTKRLVGGFGKIWYVNDVALGVCVCVTHAHISVPLSFRIVMKFVHL